MKRSMLVDAGEEHELKPRAAMYAPPGIELRTLNTGDTPLKLICVFVPPAPADYIEKTITVSSMNRGK